MFPPPNAISRSCPTIKPHVVAAIAVVLIVTTWIGHKSAVAEERQNAIAMHGAPALPASFTHFPYVVPDAPKGGRLTLARKDAFDSLNPFIPKGTVPDGMRALVYESLMARSADEPFSLYGLIAEAIEVPKDRAWIIFHLNPKARFSDGKPITADDVIFSHDILRRQGHLYMRGHYKRVGTIEKLSKRSVKFTFNAEGDRELALIMGLMPILPKHATDTETFANTSLKKPIGSGPYIVDKVEQPHALSYRRNPDYWGIDHPTRRGTHNFDEIRLLFYRDDTAVFEAFKTGATQFRVESDPARWINGYDFPAIREDQARQTTFQTGWPAGMAGLVFNTRRGKFADIRVRQALTMAFDAPAINRSIFHGRFVRSDSFFARSTLASTGKPATAAERTLLKPFPDAVQPDIMNGTWKLPGAGLSHRDRLRKAFQLLQAAGYRLENRKLVNQATKVPLSIELLVRSSGQERIALLFKKSLERLGIEIKLRRVEASQYWAKLREFDYDMIQFRYSASLSPGNEQFNRWADINGSLNFAGVQNPAVNAMIDAMLAATDREDFEAAVRAFDRVLLSGNYLIPLFHIPEQWYAVWSSLRYPPKPPLRGTSYTTWWFAKTP